MLFCNKLMGRPFSRMGGGSADRKSLREGEAPKTSEISDSRDWEQIKHFRVRPDPKWERACKHEEIGMVSYGQGWAT